MRKLLVSVAVLGLVAGCSLNVQFVRSVDEYTKVILPEYRTYVQKDTTLDEDTKRIRSQTADRFQLLIDDAKKPEAK